MSQQWEVKMTCQGRPLTEVVTASSQSEAREKAKRLNPGYNPGSTKQI